MCLRQNTRYESTVSLHNVCTSLLRVTICCVFSILESKILPLEFVACFIELGTTGTSQFQVKVIMQLITNECNTLYSTTIKSKLQ